MKKQGEKIDIVSVSRLVGVSPATVSRAINHPDLVHPATRKKIDAAIRKTGYIRNRAAQTMHGRRSATIGLIVPTVDHAIFAEVVQAFSDAVSEEGFTVLLATHGYDLKTEYNVLRKLLEHRVDGVALIGLDHSADTYRLIEQQGVPALAIWSYAPDSPISSVGADNTEAGRVAAEHLVLLGHRRIGIVFPPTAENDRARARFEGATAAFAAVGIDVPVEWMGRSLYSIAQSKSVCLDLLRRSEPPSALLCGNDVIAQGAVSAAMTLGLNVPRDISIIGIGDFAGSADMMPALTTVRIPAGRIGSLAGRHLIDAIASPDSLNVVRTRLDVELMMRATTAPPKQR
ncbi:LacI family DNA-binding transcriptional regulator [Tropicimonas sp. IMCC34043]|uniref:LacI family DNA-binding transcriptional regulator n=1 Tax=Tropicimonas sp. IMCC34043 TaxID=2248760 RepID=UPI001E46AA97|nr:LacI family DNA-binding transcriptional regulator [Tropicimonas sp. IMCC34043]